MYLNTDSSKTPCPECGKPMPMVTWVGKKPKCRSCMRKGRLDRYNPWMGILDPVTGEETSITMNNQGYNEESELAMKKDVEENKEFYKALSADEENPNP